MYGIDRMVLSHSPEVFLWYKSQLGLINEDFNFENIIGNMT